MKNKKFLGVLENRHQDIVCEIARVYKLHLDGLGDHEIKSLHLGTDGEIHYENSGLEDLIYIGEICEDHMKELDESNPFSPYIAAEAVFKDVSDTIFYKAASDEYDPFDWDPTYIGRMMEEEGGGC